MAEKKLQMTEGSITGILLRFALPLLLGHLFQQLYNAADSLVVGNFCGDSALAAVSSAGSLCHLLIGFFQGSFIGGSVVISHRYGACDREGVDKAVHSMIIFALVAGSLLSIAGVCFTPTILRWMGTPENVLPNSILYFRIYCAGMLSLVLYNTSNGIFQALGESKRPLRYLIISSVTNVLLDLLFVGVFQMGIAGAALATIAGQSLSAFLGFRYLMSGRFPVKVDLKKLRPDIPTLQSVIRLGLPSGVQNSMISIANLVVQANINAFGDQAMAGCGSYSKIEGFAFLPIVSLSLALTTFVGQNLGAGKEQRIRSGMKIGIAWAMGMAAVIGIAFFLLAPQLISLFSKSEQVIAFGVQQARVQTLFYSLLAFSHAASAVLRGAGRTVTPMVVMLSVWCLFRIFYITVAVRLVPRIAVVFSAYPITWAISSIIFFLLLSKGSWLKTQGQRL